jgi:hypothetical protein
MAETSKIEWTAEVAATRPRIRDYVRGLWFCLWTHTCWAIWMVLPHRLAFGRIGDTFISSCGTLQTVDTVADICPARWRWATYAAWRREFWGNP